MRESLNFFSIIPQIFLENNVINDGKMWNEVEFVWIDVKMMWKNVGNMWLESEVDEKNREVAQFFPKAILGVSAPITKWKKQGSGRS